MESVFEERPDGASSISFKTMVNTAAVSRSYNPVQFKFTFHIKQPLRQVRRVVEDYSSCRIRYPFTHLDRSSTGSSKEDKDWHRDAPPVLVAGAKLFCFSLGTACCVRSMQRITGTYRDTIVIV